MSRTNDKLESAIDEDKNVDKKIDESIEDNIKSVDNTFKEIFQEISDSLVRLSGNSKDVKQLAEKLFTEKEEETTETQENNNTLTTTTTSQQRGLTATKKKAEHPKTSLRFIDDDKLEQYFCDEIKESLDKLSPLTSPKKKEKLRSQETLLIRLNMIAPIVIGFITVYIGVTYQNMLIALVNIVNVILPYELNKHRSKVEECNAAAKVSSGYKELERMIKVATKEELVKRKDEILQRLTTLDTMTDEVLAIKSLDIPTPNPSS